MARSARHEVGDREHGSVAMVLIAAIIIGGLVAGFFAMSIMAQKTVRADRSFNTAINGAEAAVQHAVTTIGQLAADDSSTFLSGTGEVGGVEYDWTASRIGPNRWEVKGEGSVGGKTRRLEAVVRRPAIFWVAAFADLGVSFRGGNGADSYDGNTTDTGNGSVGSNGEIDMEGNSFADFIFMFGEGQCSGNGCDSGNLRGFEETYDIEASAALVEEMMDEACAGQDFTSWRTSVHQATQPLTGDQAYCFSDMNFDADTVLQNASGEHPVKVFVTGDIQSGNHLEVNCDECEHYYDATSPYMPDSKALQIYSLGGAVRLGNHNWFSAAVLAPRAACTGGGNGNTSDSGSNAQTDVFGSMICGSLGNQGGWKFHFDDRLLGLGNGQFEVSELREEVGGSTSF